MVRVPSSTVSEEREKMLSRRALAITDLLAVAAILVIVTALGVPTLERARELSKRMVCAVNLKALGGASAVYADAHKGEWMTPPYRRESARSPGIEYLCDGNNSYDTVCVGFERHRPSYSETFADPFGGTPAVTTTRAFWMLVRSESVSVKQFVCPSSLNDVSDPMPQVDLYYDFAEYRNISYGYRVPFGPPDTQPRSGADNGLVFAADKGPFYRDVILDPYTLGPGYSPLQESHAPHYWSPMNSPNHGGQGNGEGQNALHADGHVVFYRKPIAGIDGDNIYTLMLDQWGNNPFGRTHGDSPHDSAATNPFPGKEAFGNENLTSYSTTDSLIYP